MRCALLHLFSGRDNATLDIGRILWMKVVVAYIALSGWHVVHAGGFDPVAWGTGGAALLAAGGAAIGLKAHAEPGSAS